MSHLARWLLAAACASPVWAQVCPPTPERDALRQISQCLSGQDCRGRTVRETENLGRGCENEIEVWWRATDARSAAIRDRKMCFSRRKRDADPAFTHGLIIPLEPVCGVEDPQLYQSDSRWRALWADAWAAARTRIPEERIMLVVNPPTIRSLTHLHIHIMKDNGTLFPPGEAVRLERLEDVWARAAEIAATKAAMTGRNFGIAVRKGAQGFEMLIEPGAPANLRNPESKYGWDEDR